MTSKPGFLPGRAIPDRGAPGKVRLPGRGGRHRTAGPWRAAARAAPTDNTGPAAGGSGTRPYERYRTGGAPGKVRLPGRGGRPRGPPPTGNTGPAAGGSGTRPYGRYRTGDAPGKVRLPGRGGRPQGPPLRIIPGPQRAGLGPAPTSDTGQGCPWKGEAAGPWRAAARAAPTCPGWARPG